MIEIRKIIKHSFYLLLSFFVFISCSNNIEFTEYRTLDNSVWKAKENLVFNFTIQDTIFAKNMFINIRNNQEYKYSNLYVITSLKFPDKNTVIDTLQYEMANEKGEYLGVGFSNIKENKLFYKESKIFPLKGDYEFSIYHAMRKQGDTEAIKELEGIQDIGISIEKIN